MVKDVSFPEAALGIRVDIKTLEDEIELRVPDGTQNGDVLRVRNKGMPGLHGRGQGDLYVEIHVKTPKKLSRKAKKLLEELKNELNNEKY